MKQLGIWLSSIRHSCSRWLVPFTLVMGISLTSGCSQLAGTALNAALGGGGPNVNAQVGREVTQQAVANQQDRSVTTGENSRVSITETRDTVRTDSAENITVNQLPWWVFVSVVAGSVLLGTMIDDVIRAGWNKLRQK